MTFITWGADDTLVNWIRNSLEEFDNLVVADSAVSLLLEPADLIVIDFDNLAKDESILFGKLMDGDCFKQQHFLIFEDQEIPAKTAQASIVWTIPRSKVLPCRLKVYMDRIRKLKSKKWIEPDGKPFFLLQIVGYLRKNEYASTEDIAKLCSISKRTAQRYLQEFSHGWENITYSNTEKKWWMPGKISRAMEPEKFDSFPLRIEGLFDEQ